MTFNIRLLAAMAAFGAIACTNGDDDGTETDETDGTTDGTDICTSGIKGTPFPANGATGVYYRSTFFIEFISDEKATATFSLSDGTADVALGTPTWSDDGTSVYFNTAAPLAPSTSYTLTVDYSCEKSAPIQFTTSEVGSAVESTDFLENAYALDLATATIIEPPGVNSLLGSLLGELDQAIVFVPKAYDDVAKEIEFFGGLTELDGTQDTCEPTIVFPVAASYEGNPYFEISAPEGITLDAAGVSITLDNLELSGAFSPGGDAIVGITLAASVDTRGLADIVGDLGGGEGGGDSAVCDLVAQFLGQDLCEECPGGGKFCLGLVAANAVAEGKDWTLVEVAEACDTDVAVEASAE